MAFLVIAVMLITFYFILSTMTKREMSKFKEKINRINGKLSSDTIDRYDRRDAQNNIEKYQEDINKYKKINTIIRVLCAGLAIVCVACSLVAIVPTGYTGIKTTFGKVENDVLSSGINFKLPWQSVINMDNREQRSPFALQAFSKDIQQVDIQGSINFNIDKAIAMNLYKDVGTEYPTILVGPRVQEDVKIVIARYTAENLIENRQKASDAIYELIKDELSQKGINVISFAIENIDFTDAFESAVEAKQVATQEKQKAQTEQEKQTMEMQQQAERDRIKAQAEADVKKIEADAKAYAVKVEADAQAEANKKIAETLSESLIKYNMAKQWDGRLPTVQTSSNMNGIIDLRSLFNEEQ